jgi:hypothetical protein
MDRLFLLQGHCRNASIVCVNSWKITGSLVVPRVSFCCCYYSRKGEKLKNKINIQFPWKQVWEWREENTPKNSILDGHKNKREEKRQNQKSQRKIKIWLSLLFFASSNWLFKLFKNFMRFNWELLIIENNFQKKLIFEKVKKMHFPINFCSVTLSCCLNLIYWRYFLSLFCKTQTTHQRARVFTVCMLTLSKLNDF